MAKLKAFKPGEAKTKRKASGLNQTDYWGQYGMTQSAGSRYEGGRDIPRPMAMLMWLHESGRISNDDLANALKATQKKIS